MSAKKYPDAAAFILAGGRSSRMGRDKAWLELAGVPLVLRIARGVQPLVSAVTVIGPPASDAGRFESIGLAAIADRLPARVVCRIELGTSRRHRDGTERHAMLLESGAGLRSALHHHDLARMAARARWRAEVSGASGAQAVVPERSGGVEPLAAVYRKECAQVLADALGRDVRKVSEAWRDLRVARIPEAEWRALDPEGNVLANMNTLEEYARACQWWDEKEKRKAAAG